MLSTSDVFGVMTGSYCCPSPPPPQSALLLTEVLKEREAQIELKQRVRNTNRDVEKRFLDVMKSREDEAQRQEEERVLQRKMEIQAVAQDLRKQ